MPEKITGIEEQEDNSQEEKDSNIVFIGTKPFMNYVKSVFIQFTAKNQNEVIVKARGKFINRAVDVAEVSKKHFAENQNIKLNVKDIKIGRIQEQRRPRYQRLNN